VDELDRPANNSQLSCSLARSPEYFCEKMLNLIGKMLNFRRKCIEIDFSHRKSKELMEK